MALVHMDSRKWPDRRHWQYMTTRLGEDEHGVWLHASAQTVAQRGEEPPQPLRRGFVSLVPAGDWWIAEFYWTHPLREVYVNIGTPPSWHGERVRQIDLDLDVVRNHDGSVHVLDQDEFAAHQVELDYPQWLIDGAQITLDCVVPQLRERREPFGAAAAGWIDLARRG